MAWLAVTLVVPPGLLAQCDALFEDLQAAAVTTLPLDEQTPPVLEPAPGATPTWSQNRLQALFPLSADVTQLRAGLAEALPEPVLASLTVDFLEDQNWLNSWRQHATQACFGERLWLLPKDAPMPAAATADQVVLRLDPGMAFGSGGHPTTQLCLHWLAQQDLRGKRVLDYGCGSGVLAIAAALLGARQVDAVDIDPQALTATRNNAQYNQISEPVVQTWLPQQLQPQGYDIVVANILANPLVSLAGVLSDALLPGGNMVLAGLLEEQQTAVANAYPQLRFTAVAQEQWVRLAGVKQADQQAQAS